MLYESPLKGQGLPEYALIMTFVSVGVVLILVIFAPALSNIYANIITRL